MRKLSQTNCLLWKLVKFLSFVHQNDYILFFGRAISIQATLLYNIHEVVMNGAFRIKTNLRV